jgi:poly(hydroxyalkanoate) depolymerase family esterase
MDGLWTRLKDRFTRFFRREPAPGHFVEGTKWSWRGFLDGARFVLPRRSYLLYVPRGHSRWRRAPLLVLCHGCKQTVEELVKGTRIVELADRIGCLVLLPRQADNANPWRCWNWFDAANVRGAGEAAIVAAMIESVRRSYRADSRRVVVAGMSAGGAFAAALGVRHPALVRGVVVHSGLACGAAASALTAISVMSRGPDTDVVALAREARTTETHVPLLAIHGLADNVVAPRNSVALVRQYLVLNGVDMPVGAASALPPTTSDASNVVGGRAVRTREWRRNSRLLVRLIEIEGLGHAWSGGDAALPFNDASPPDATALTGAFIGEHVQ